MKIPLYKADITQTEIDAIQRVLQSKKLSRGSEVEKFENEFAQYVNKKYAISVNSGTSGLHLAVRLLGWGKGDEVITTPFSYIASSNALLFENVTPVFVDIDPNTLNIDPSLIESKIGPKTKGIMLVHILGLPVNYEKIKEIKDRYGLKIIEDSCEAIGTPSARFPVSQLGDLSVYGFHENKQITTAGEGGMIVTDDVDLATRCRSMRDQGRASGENWLKKVTLGFNFRMTEIQAAFGREQLKRVDAILSSRNKSSDLYKKYLSDIKDIKLPQQMSEFERSWFIYFVLFKDKITRDSVHDFLKQKGVEVSKNYFPSITQFPMYSFCKDRFPVTEDASDRLLALPMFNDLTEEEIKYVSDCIREFLTQ